MNPEFLGQQVEESDPRAPESPVMREVELCTDLGQALHGHGVSALRLEQLLVGLSNALGVPGQFFTTPTAIFTSYRLPGKVRSHVQLVRAEPGAVDLGRVADLEQLVEDVRRGRSDTAGARSRLESILATPPAYSAIWMVAAAALISGAAAVFLGGGAVEVAMASAAGILIGVLETAAARHGTAKRLVPPTVAALAAVAAVGLWGLNPSFSVATAQVASLIILVPGLEFTLAITEIATANLVSGAARLTSAAGDFLALGFGVAIGTQVGVRVFRAPTYVVPEALPEVWLLPALAAAAIGFVVRFRAHPRDAALVIAACLAGYIGARAGAGVLGGQLAPFAGALVVGMAANGYARQTGRSPLVMMVPGIMLLVPGSFGFRSFDLIMRDDVVTGVQTAFAMGLVGTALSTGLLVANLLLPAESSVDR